MCLPLHSRNSSFPTRQAWETRGRAVSEAQWPWMGWDARSLLLSAWATCGTAYMKRAVTSHHKAQQHITTLPVLVVVDLKVLKGPQRTLIGHTAVEWSWMERDARLLRENRSLSQSVGLVNHSAPHPKKPSTGNWNRRSIRGRYLPILFTAETLVPKSVHTDSRCFTVTVSWVNKWVIAFAPLAEHPVCAYPGSVTPAT